MPKLEDARKEYVKFCVKCSELSAQCTKIKDVYIKVSTQMEETQHERDKARDKYLKISREEGEE